MSNSVFEKDLPNLVNEHAHACSPIPERNTVDSIDLNLEEYVSSFLQSVGQNSSA